MLNNSNSSKKDSNIHEEDGFNDSFFHRDDDFFDDSNTHNSTNSNSKLEEEKGNIKLVNYDEVDYNRINEDVDRNNKKILLILLSASAIGVLGYFGNSYLLNSDKNSTTIETKEVNLSRADEKKEVVKQSIISTPLVKSTPMVENTPEIKETPIVKSTPKVEATPVVKSTPIDDRQQKMLESVIKTLKEKKEKSKEIIPSATPTPTEVIDRDDEFIKQLQAEVNRPKIIESVEPRKSKIVTDTSKEKKIKKEKKEKKIVKKATPKRAKYRVVIVKKGDTLASIAERYYGNPMDYKRIIRANRDIRSEKTHLKLGQKIIVPNITKAKAKRLVRVRKGDTLASIAKRFYGDRNKFQKIIDANYKIKNEHTPLHIGQMIYVPR